MWTDVKKYLQDPENTPVPQVSCPICMDPIAIRGVPGQEPCPYKIVKGEQKVGAVLFCSHIVCQMCIWKHIFAQIEWAEGINNIEGPVNCPYCRYDLLYPECTSLMSLKRVPIATGEDESIVPLTRPELEAEGTPVPARCFACIRDGSALQDPDVTELGELTIEEFWEQINSSPSWLSREASHLILDVAFINDPRLGQLAKKSPDDGVDVIMRLEEIEINNDDDSDSDYLKPSAVWSVPLWREEP